MDDVQEQAWLGDSESPDAEQDKLDQFLADTFPCSDPLPQPLFLKSLLLSMNRGYSLNRDPLSPSVVAKETQRHTA